jgi:preprotein translocase subunit SecD
MRKVSRGWVLTIVFISLMSLIFLAPTFAGDNLPSWWSKIFPSKGIRLGLDLKGGIFLLLGVQVDESVEIELNSINEIIKNDLTKSRALVKSSNINGSTLTLNFYSNEDLDKALTAANDNFSNVASISANDLSLNIQLNSEYIKELKKNSLSQVKQVIENRVADFGLVEPSIQTTGDDRILIQVPGASQTDRERIVDLIRKTAVLEFKIVNAAGITEDIILQGQGVTTKDELTAKNLEIHPGETGNQNENFFLTEDIAKVTGESISDARISFDNFGRPAVLFRFKGDGATSFGELTGENIGQRLAIVLDGNVKSAPVVNDKITYEGTITGTFTPEEAKDLALVLRSGSLPVPVAVEQERSVGPSLGQDSIDKGRLSMIVGGILVILFMAYFYRLQGIVADIALLLNMLFIMGFLSAFGVTLTLPGIAGLVLTLGMAVDGNIIIFERIKEELHTGKTPLASIEAGYSRSLWTILDANITTLLTALILFWFGTGPVKGFAATLSIGIISTVFSNVIVARLITNYLYRDKEISTVSI